MSKPWCSHMNAGSIWEINKPGFCNFNDWKFCPICATPRPTELSLEEKFFEYWDKCRTQAPTTVGIAKELADIARKHFQEKEL